MKLQAILGAAAVALTLLGSHRPHHAGLGRDRARWHEARRRPDLQLPRARQHQLARPGHRRGRRHLLCRLGHLFEGLYNEDAKGNPVPGVAPSYDVNADNTVYTFHLRDANVVQRRSSQGQRLRVRLAARRRSQDRVALLLLPGLVGVNNARRHRRQQDAADRARREGHRRQYPRGRRSPARPRISSA